MSKIALATAVVALTAASLAMGRAEAQAPASYRPPPGAAPPWANTTTTTETKPTTTSASVPAAQPPQTAAPGIMTPASVPAAPPATDAPGTTTSIPVAVTPMQGTTTPIHVVSLRAGPNSNTPVIGTLRPGDQLQILATANYGWTEVQSPAGTGWAYGSYLAPGGAPPIAPAPAPEVISR